MLKKIIFGRGFLKMLVLQKGIFTFVGPQCDIVRQRCWRCFWATDVGRKWAVFLFNFTSHYHIFIFLSIPSLVETDSLEIWKRPLSWHVCEMFSSGFRPWLKNVSCISSLMLQNGALKSNKVESENFNFVCNWEPKPFYFRIYVVM